MVSFGNGSVSYLKRIGVLDHGSYKSFLVAHCGVAVADSNGAAERCMCMRDDVAVQTLVGQPAVEATPQPGYLYKNHGYERAVKLLKDGLFAAFALLSLYLIRTRQAELPTLAPSWPLALLAADVSLGFAISAVAWGLAFAAIGLRSFAFLLIALLGAWAVEALPQLARWVGWLLLMEAVLVAVEFLLGIPLRLCPYSFRVAGTLVLPNSLGIFAVVAVAFHGSFAASKTWFALLLSAALALVLASGSGTGLVALFAWGAALLLQRQNGVRRWLAGAGLVVLAAGMIAALPVITQRPDIYDSLFADGGRVQKLHEVMRMTNATESLVGRGLGFGTNTATNLVDLSSLPVPTLMGAAQPFYADSTVTMLFTQLGAVGIAAFYLLLAWAFRRDRAAQPFYLVIAVCSLTMNIIELFPVNFLLGLALAHTLSVDSPRARTSRPNEHT